MDLQTTRHLEQLFELLAMPKVNLQPVMLFEHHDAKMNIEVTQHHVFLGFQWPANEQLSFDLLPQALSSVSPSATDGFPMRICLLEGKMIAQISCPLPLFQAQLAYELIRRLFKNIEQVGQPSILEGNT